MKLELQRSIDRVFPPKEVGHYPYWRLIPRGWSQMYFQSNEVTGLCFLVAVVLVTPVAGAYLVVSGAIAPAARRLLGTDNETLSTGLPGLNPSLVALAIPAAFVCDVTDVGMWVVLVVCVLATVGLTHLSVRYLPLPTLAVPSLITFWVLDAVSNHLGVLQPVTSSTTSTYVFYPLTALLDSLGAALFAPAAVSGALVAVGILISSWRPGVVAICGAAIGAFVSYYYGSVDAGSIDLGPYGFNGVLAAVAVYAVCGGRLRLALLGALIATILVPAIGLLPVETLAAPAVLATWAVIGLGWLETRWFRVPTEPAVPDAAP